jgi:hypothetical protein
MAPIDELIATYKRDPVAFDKAARKLGKLVRNGKPMADDPRMSALTLIRKPSVD